MFQTPRRSTGTPQKRAVTVGCCALPVRQLHGRCQAEWADENPSCALRDIAVSPD